MKGAEIEMEPNEPLSAEDAIAAYRTSTTEELTRTARALTERIHGKGIWVRGLVEISNRCRRNCLYCGIRRGNEEVVRYTMSGPEVLSVVERGVGRKIWSFVLQSGELDPIKTDDLARLVESIRSKWPDIALTLSCGTLSRSEYRRLKAAGADRYLLRFETSDEKLFAKLRDRSTLKRRLRALTDLKELGYQTGSGFMLGLPGETPEIRMGNALLCKTMECDMVGIGPFIPHPGTPLHSARSESFELTERMTAFVRLLLPFAHVPATTAAGTMDERGRERMIMAGANVVMPNITPQEYARHYFLYPGKSVLDEKMENFGKRLTPLGRELRFGRGDCLKPGEPTINIKRSA